MSVTMEECKNTLELTEQELNTLKELVQTINTMKEQNVLKDLLDLAHFISGATRALNSGAVIKMANIAGTAVETGDRVLADLGGMETINKVLDAVEQAKEDIKHDTSKVGFGSLLKLMKDPGVQNGLKFMLAVTKNLSK
ncbi:DUF1641 domain-containing protein [Tepidibacillus sp. HK-1]|uniref:DUF1641 domain-containing protein n=1 Tax=Tepidibacillus sp. HK-1 TaxID=1883407 RepID=UPI000852D5D1|nr:DUF1641 domain-containing protein [Tepidibacillus sp. HK-1]GBF12417.1 hypothetical protein HK1_02480 [Tepidibacillus sp. HK-1]